MGNIWRALSNLHRGRRENVKPDLSRYDIMKVGSLFNSIKKYMDDIDIILIHHAFGTGI